MNKEVKIGYQLWVGYAIVYVICNMAGSKRLQIVFRFPKGREFFVVVIRTDVENSKQCV